MRGLDSFQAGFKGGATVCGVNTFNRLGARRGLYRRAGAEEPLQEACKPGVLEADAVEAGSSFVGERCVLKYRIRHL